MDVSWAQNTVIRALSEWTSQISEPLAETMYGDDFMLTGRTTLSGLGIQLTGLGSGLGIGIVIQGGQLVVKTYDSFSNHLIPNIYP